MFEDRIGFMASLGFAEMPPAEVAVGLKELGYNAVEWTSRTFNPRIKSPAELQAMVDSTRAAGLAISAVAVQHGYVCTDDAQREDRIALTCETIEACRDIGVAVVNLITGPEPWDSRAPRIPEDISEGAARQMLLDAFERIVSTLEACQVHGGVEGVWGNLCNDYYTTRPLIDHFSSEFLGVNFDPSHDILKGNFDTGWLVRQWGKKAIKHIHLKDAIGTQEQGKFLFPFLGEGRVDWQGMFTALAEIGYDGYMSVEFESFTYHDQILKGNTHEAAKRSIEEAQYLLAL